MTLELAVVSGIVAAAAGYLFRCWFIRKRSCDRCALREAVGRKGR